MDLMNKRNLFAFKKHKRYNIIKQKRKEEKNEKNRKNNNNSFR